MRERMRRIPGAVAMTWHGEQLVLLPERAAFWTRTRTLLIADPHFGKAAAFRARGVPVPAGTTRTDTERLATAIADSGAERLIVLGDFFHAAAGRAPDTLARIAAWRAAHASLDIVLVIGNHDVAAGMPPDEWRIRCTRGTFEQLPFHFRHDPAGADDAPTFAGHIHPAVSLEDAAGARIRAACFLFGERVALLPAFGTFTGGVRVGVARGDRVFAVGEGEVLEVRGRGRG